MYPAKDRVKFTGKDLYPLYPVFVFVVDVPMGLPQTIYRQSIESLCMAM